MSNIVEKALSAIFGSKKERDLKKLLPYVEKINAEYNKLSSLSNDELRAKTREIQARIRQELAPYEEQIQKLRDEAAALPDQSLAQKEQLFRQIDEIEKESLQHLEEVLDECLPLGFAIVKETARRFKENEELEVTATDFDRELAAIKDYVRIEGDKAYWKNSWEAAGNRITWDMVHYDVQLIGGVVLHQGKIAEMATGEGKTLVATLPVFLNALAGKGVHLVTVNDYLARRDAEWMGPLYEFHGLRVDCIDKHPPHSAMRRRAYEADITYGTNNEFGFDYLRDNMVRHPEELVQRGHHYAIVDEVDSVLIDEARTPLIISGPIPKGDQSELYRTYKPRVEALVNEQRRLVTQFLNEAKKKIEAGDTKEGGLALFRAYRGLPKYRPLIKYLSEPGIKKILQKTEAIYLAENSKLMPEADAPLFFTIDEKNNLVQLTEKGLEAITKAGEDPNFFVLPDIGTEIAKIENDESLSPQEKVEKKEALIEDYKAKSERIHAVNQLLKAYCLFEKDVDYIIDEGKVKIVDEQTGRVMEGRRYSDGLHQALEAKENVKIEDATQTYATITLQNYFRMYHKLAGMTGTAETEADEFREIYGLDVAVIPTNKPVIRDDRPDKVYKTMRAKLNAVIAEIEEMRANGRPVLVGTTSVEMSEIISRMLQLRKIPHQVLNAKHHQREAEIVANAGQVGTVTIATNMAGRGTDIKLSPEAKAAGGLAIIGTERHESRRVDRQLRGRAGRQGDPGSSQFFVSLEDNLMRLFGSDRIAKVMDRMGMDENEVIQSSMVSKSIERAQKKVEENNFAIRKRLLEYDDVMNVQREHIYKRRRHALFGDRLDVDINQMFAGLCQEIVEALKAQESYEDFKLEVIATFGFEPAITAEEFEREDVATLVRKLYTQARAHYDEKNQRLLQQIMPFLKEKYQEIGDTVRNIEIVFTDHKKLIRIAADFKRVVETEGKELIRALERTTVLALIDQEWKEHLREMDDLRQSVQMAVHEQKDPLIIYKFEAFELFKELLARINRDVTSFLMKATLPQAPEEVREARQPREQAPKLREQKPSALNEQPKANDPSPVQKTAPIQATKTIGRNEKVTVRYHDGRVLKDVKYKKVEQDILNNRCVIIEE